MKKIKVSWPTLQQHDLAAFGLMTFAIIVGMYVASHASTARAERERLASAARAMSSAVSIETLDILAASPGRLTVPSAIVGRVLAEQGNALEIRFAVLRPDRGVRVVAQSGDSEMRALDIPWPMPRELRDSLANYVAGRSREYLLRDGDIEIAVAPIFRDATTPAGLAIVQVRVPWVSAATWGVIAQLLWIPALALLAGILLIGRGELRGTRAPQRESGSAPVRTNVVTRQAVVSTRMGRAEQRRDYTPW